MTDRLFLRHVLPFPEECRLNAKDFELLASARHPDVGSILGPQIVGDRIVVRCWVSGAEAVSISSQALIPSLKHWTSTRFMIGHSETEGNTDSKEDVDVTTTEGSTDCKEDASGEQEENANDAEDNDGDSKVPLELCQTCKDVATDAAWLFEAAFENEGSDFEDVWQLKKALSYELHIEYKGGGTASWRDPYSFGKLLPDEFLTNWASGKPCQSPAEMLGSHHLEIQQGLWGTRFCVWAPHAQAVSVIGDFNFWNGRAHPMCQRRPFGIWELFLPVWDLRGKKYAYQILPCGDGNEQRSPVVKADPMALEFELMPCHDAKVPTCDDYSRAAWSGMYNWGDEVWLQQREKTADLDTWASKPLAIYEVHLPTWSVNEKGTALSYKELAEILPEYVAELGFNAVEFLPVTQYPNEASWGYQCAAGLYAVDSRLGTPDDFRALIDALHKHSIAVIIDFVAAHFAKDEWGLTQYSGAPQYEYAGTLGELPQWGTARYDFSKPEVRSYLIGAVEHWIEQFHVDGIRVDAVAAIVYENFGREEDGDAIMAGRGVTNDAGVSFLRELCGRVRETYPGVLMMAEESTNFKWVTDRLPVEGTERDKVKLDHLGFHLKWNMGYTYDSLAFLATEYSKRSQLETFGWKKLAWYLQYAYNERWILPFSHDNVHHQSLLDQMTASSEVDIVKQHAQLRALLLYTIGMPGRPLLFMGIEVGESAWSHEKVIDWAAAKADPVRQQLKSWVAKVLHVYRDIPALHCEDDNKSSFTWLDIDTSNRCILAWQRSAAKGSSDVIVVVNFSPTDVIDYQVAVDPDLIGKWRCIANSSSSASDGEEAKICAVTKDEAKAAKLTTDIPGFSAQLWLAPKIRDVKVTFEVHKPDTDFGQQVCVVGDCPEFGEWVSEAGVLLETSAETFPIWKGEVALKTSLSDLEFKFIIRGPAGQVHWEPVDWNRSVSIEEDCVHVSAQFGTT
jgi:1,4-alpha-glucan branching enzyme